MPQRFGLYEDLTVKQNMNLYADLTGVIGEERNETYERLLKFTTLKPFEDRLAKNLSGGMKQKLGLACALIRKPALLLLDEPSVGVDPISRRELWDMVQDLLKEGITVLWSTAYQDEAERCDTVLLLNEGKSLYYGPPKELTKRVQDRVFLLANIIGSRRQVLMKALSQPNVIDGIIQGMDVRIVLKEPDISKVDIPALDNGNELAIHPASPRFEDAFVDILGGGPGGRSVLAEKTPEVKEKKKETVEAEDLTKKFGSFTAASNITFHVKGGKYLVCLAQTERGNPRHLK